jgi:hypothetical protein
MMSTSGMVVGIAFMAELLLSAVVACIDRSHLWQVAARVIELLGADETFAVSDFFRAGDFQALTVFNGFDEVAGFDQVLVG